MGRARHWRKPRAHKTEFKGKVYDSKLEAHFAMKWDQMRKDGLIHKIERQVTVPIIVNGVPVCKLIVDWRLTYPDGHIEYTECKGKLGDTPVWRLKKRLFEACYPDRIYTVVRPEDL
jgi:hypothetical protein